LHAAGAILSHGARPARKANVEYGDPGAVAAQSGAADRHSPARPMDGCGRAAVVEAGCRVFRLRGGDRTTAEENEKDRLLGLRKTMSVGRPTGGR
jgi:hypothetical protein